MIEAPSSDQKLAGASQAAARMLADGRSMDTVFVELRKRGLGEEAIEDLRPDIERRFVGFVRERRRRLCLEGSLWLVVGLVIPVGLILYHALFSVWLIIATIPAWYGFYLLMLPPLCEPVIKPPALFGRNL